MRWSRFPAHVRQIPGRLVVWWKGLRRRQRIVVVAGAALASLIIVLGAFTWSGVSAALEAQRAYRELQTEMSHLTPVDLVQVNVYDSLEGRFREAEDASARARSRLGFLRAFKWVPVLGNRIKQVHLLLDMGFYQGRAGRNLAGAYASAIALDLEDLPPDAAATQVSLSLQRAAPKLTQARRDLGRVAELRRSLADIEKGTSFGVLVDRYLPAIQTVAYLSLKSPGVIGHTYSLSRELTSLQDAAADPLDVLGNPEEVGKALRNITEQAVALESDFELVRRATEVGWEGDPQELEAAMSVLDTLIPGVTLLRHVTAGTRSLVTIAEAMESSGFLSSEFGSVAGVALEDAQSELTLAREEVDSLQDLLSVQGIDAETFLPSAVFDPDSDVSISSTERVEVMLDEAIGATRFLHAFLGFDRPKTYLLLGQNQKEIRATGGFIGLAVQATVDRDEQTELVFHDSTTVDREPLTDNPTPPEGLFWYLWMGRLLFRDANWNPHFPSSAAKAAEIYRLGQGGQVDGVITDSKDLMLDLVNTFGDITVPGDDSTLDRETAGAYTDGDKSYPCLPGRVSTLGKRCFDEDVFFAMRERLTSDPIPSTLRRGLVELIKDHLDRKNILIQVFHPTDDSFLWERGWNGAVPLVDHDHVFVVDSSLPGHSTAGVSRSLEYRLSLDPDRPVRAELRLRYDNEDEPEDKTCLQYAWEIYHCYWNYFRVYVSPQASDIQMPQVPLHEGALKLVWGYPDADSTTVVRNADTGPARLTELGGYIVVEPGSAVTVPIQYKLPAQILWPTAPGAYEYRLLVQKQPGMDSDRVRVAVELPSGAELLETSPEYNSRQARWLLFDFTLHSDTKVVVSFRMTQAG